MAADKKISQLPSGQLLPQSIIPIVTNGTTSQTTFDGLINALSQYFSGGGSTLIIHQLPDITFPVDPSQSYIVADMYDTDSESYKTVRIETTQLVPTLKNTLQQSNVTDGNNINISSNDRIISTPLADDSQTDVNIIFRSGLVSMINFTPLIGTKSYEIGYEPTGGNGTDLKLNLIFDSSDTLINIEITNPGYNYLMGDIVTIPESVTGIPDFTVTVIETIGSVNGKTPVKWLLTGPVSEYLVNSALILDKRVELTGSNGVNIHTLGRLSLSTSSASVGITDGIIMKSKSKLESVVDNGIAKSTFVQDATNFTLISTGNLNVYTQTTDLAPIVLLMSGLPVYANNADAITGGLVADQVYKTATGELRIVV